jgi:hypothetical protein
MALIPSNPEKIYEESVGKIRPLSESTAQQIGGSVNYVLDQIPLLDGIIFTKITFLSNALWTVPSNVTRVIVEGCGGGSGGGSGFNSGSPLFFNVGGAGGVGSAKGYGSLTVTPNADLLVTVGNGGAGGIGDDSPGLPGGNSSIGSLVFAGAVAPIKVIPPFPYDTELPPQGQSLGMLDRRVVQTDEIGAYQNNTSPWFNIYGFSTPIRSGGFNGGSGGAGPYGSGTLGASPSSFAQVAVANSGAGGGGGYGPAATTYNQGSAGAAGRVIVSFYTKP